MESPLSTMDDGAESQIMEVNPDDPDNDQVRMTCTHLIRPETLGERRL